jgi:hypothetical protein
VITIDMTIVAMNMPFNYGTSQSYSFSRFYHHTLNGISLPYPLTLAFLNNLCSTVFVGEFVLDAAQICLRIFRMFNASSP